ncbi:MAG: 50S ribosomal protein L11 methyltransferase [Acidobacteriota bacterium]
MHILRLECAPEDRDLLIAELWERGTTGITEEDAVLQAFFEAPFGTAQWERYHPRWEKAEERDWIEVSREPWKPLLLGERFFLVPAWQDAPTPPGRLRIEMRPGLGYGTGWGEPTQLALEAIEKRLRPGAVVLDFGTGSGILAVAAARLGAGRIYACDIDREVAAAAQERFRDEGIGVGLFAGSIRSVRTASIDFLAANINAETLTGFASEILRVLAPDGRAVLSGFPDRHLERLRAAFANRGEVLVKGDWRALVW